jgi:Mitochondrial carrier protein
MLIVSFIYINLMSISKEDISYHILTGATAGFVGTLVSHPADTCKVHIQNKEPLGILKRTLNENRKWAYRGMKPSIIGYTIEKTLVFGTYLTLRDILQFDEQNMLHIFGAGLVSGLVASPSITIFEQIKTDRQMKITTQYTPNYLLKGWKYTAAREGLGFSIYFNIYNWMTHQFNQNENDSLSWKMTKTAGIGSLSAFCSWIPIYPFDINKTRIQSGRMLGGSLINDFRNANGIVNKMRVFYRGYPVCMLRAVPFHATCFVVFDLAKHYKKSAIEFKKKTQINFDKFTHGFNGVFS